VEAVPATPDGAAVWFAGYWTWQGDSYVWMRGGWVLAPPGARFATWQFFYDEDGLPMFTPGVWYDAMGDRL